MGCTTRLLTSDDGLIILVILEEYMVISLIGACIHLIRSICGELSEWNELSISTADAGELWAHSCQEFEARKCLRPKV